MSIALGEECLHVWQGIRDELASLQDLSCREKQGEVVNPVTRAPYSQNTSCAALVFATEYARTGLRIWLSRTQAAIDSLKKYDIYVGLDEPKWYRLGWEFHRGSLFTTGTLLDAYWKALGLLGRHDDDEVTRLWLYIESCRIKRGIFAHDTVQDGHTPPPVQNTSAIALYLMEEIAAHHKPSKISFAGECDVTVQFLLKGQRSDGFWPYIYPGSRQQLAFKSRPLRVLLRYAPLLRNYFIKGGDHSIFFGDAVHQCLVLYYLAKSIKLRRPNARWEQALNEGWRWIRQHLHETGDGGLRFNFDWEPYPHGFRWCNFRDTSTYFVILATLPYLSHLGVKDDFEYISKGLLIHIARALSNGSRFGTSILPYEGPDELIRFILPRVGEAAAWKGALLAEFILGQEQLAV